MTNKELVIANKDRLQQWQSDGWSYFRMARAIGIGERGTGIISRWFLAQGIRRKVAR